MQTLISCGLSLGLLVALPFANADTLFKKRTAVGIGFGDAVKATIDWADCERKNRKTYAKPPYWVDKADNCKLRAEGMGLKREGKQFRVANQQKFSLIFPDSQLNDPVEYAADTHGTIHLSSRGRTIVLPFGREISDPELVTNQIAVTVGFQNLGNREAAAETVHEINDTLVSAIDDRPPASVSFFASTFNSLQSFYSSPELAQLSYSALVRLAAYRSALEPPPVGVTWQPRSSFPIGGHDVEIGGSYYDFGGGDGFVLKPGAARVFVHDNIMRNGSQTLDGITWWNDVFVNMTIHYRGGPLALKNVRFVNCRFEVVENQRGQQVLALAILRHQALQIPAAESSTQPNPTAAILNRSLPLQRFKTK